MKRHDVTVESSPTDVRDSDSSLKDLVQLWLVEELRVPGLDGLELDGHLLAVGDVDAEVDVAEAAAADLPDLKSSTTQGQELFRMQLAFSHATSKVIALTHNK